MRIGFDGLSITAQPAGMGGVALNVLVAMAQSPEAPTMVAVLPRDSAADGAIARLRNVEVIRAPSYGPDTVPIDGFELRQAQEPSRARRRVASAHGGRNAPRAGPRRRSGTRISARARSSRGGRRAPRNAWVRGRGPARSAVRRSGSGR